MIAFVKMHWWQDAFDRRTLTDCHDILDCGGKRSATPLSDARNAQNFRHASPARKRRRRSALPAQSKTPHLAVRTNQCRLVSQTSLTNAPAGSKLSLAFAYDSKCRRIQKLVSTNSGSGYVGEYTNNFVYDGWNLLASLTNSTTLFEAFTWGLDLSGSVQGSPRESGTSLTGGAGGVGGLLEVTYYGSSTTNCFTAFDGNGNVSALISAANGSVLAQYEYGPFGELIRKTGPCAAACPFRFSTKYQDDESDLLYYGYRYYNASTGRWLSRDPIGDIDLSLLTSLISHSQDGDSLSGPPVGIIFAERMPSGLNLYGFVGNSATMKQDAFGLLSAGDIAKLFTLSLVAIPPQYRACLGGCKSYNGCWYCCGWVSIEASSVATGAFAACMSATSGNPIIGWPACHIGFIAALKKISQMDTQCKAACAITKCWGGGIGYGDPKKFTITIP